MAAKDVLRAAMSWGSSNLACSLISPNMLSALVKLGTCSPSNRFALCPLVYGMPRRRVLGSNLPGRTLYTAVCVLTTAVVPSPPTNEKTSACSVITQLALQRTHEPTDAQQQVPALLIIAVVKERTFLHFSCIYRTGRRAKRFGYSPIYDSNDSFSSIGTNAQALKLESPEHSLRRRHPSV